MKGRIARKVSKRIAEGSYTLKQRRAALRFVCRKARRNLKRIDRWVTDSILNQYRAMGFIS